MLESSYHDLSLDTQKDVIELLKKDCKYILYFYKKHKKVFYRGMKNNEAFVVKKYRKERFFKNMNKDLSDLIDEALNELGKKAKRINSIFVTTKYLQAKQYGNVFIIFPKDGFHFTFSKSVYDLFLDINPLLKRALKNRNDILFYKYKPYVFKDEKYLEIFKSYLISLIKKSTGVSPIKKDAFIKELNDDIHSFSDLSAYLKKTFYFFDDLKNQVLDFLNKNAKSYLEVQEIKELIKNEIKKAYDENDLNEAFGNFNGEVMISNSLYYGVNFEKLKKYHILNNWIEENFFL
ncbi:MAG: hypothetical protein NZZ41_00735 [Candidatus Dojkabacteria bacterium]|nr:hypothetical protein [Candidatus Dojkabacteria bacterium]